MTNNLNQNNGPLYSLMCHLLVVFLVVLITRIYQRSTINCLLGSSEKFDLNQNASIIIIEKVAKGSTFELSVTSIWALPK